MLKKTTWSCSRADAQAFKEAFEKAQEDNSKAPKSESAPAPAAVEEKKEDKEAKTAAAAEADKVGWVVALVIVISIGKNPEMQRLIAWS
jgi:predicted cobalt transporter CbtA